MFTKKQILQTDKYNIQTNSTKKQIGVIHRENKETYKHGKKKREIRKKGEKKGSQPNGFLIQNNNKRRIHSL